MGERRSDPRAFVIDRPVVLFDGLCHLCSAVVLFAIPRDPRGRLRFAPLQSEAARSLLQQTHLSGPLPDSFVLVHRGQLQVRSDAALRLLGYLRMPWPLLRAFWIIPRPIRDWAYDFIARRRYRWFGTRDACLLPTPEIRSRFLKVD
jgi:predicted DCC family thiol-disulfide oxidoreductase YuxK